jgi:hypothetical protein
MVRTLDLIEHKFLAFKILLMCEIAKIQFANITYTYFGDKSQKKGTTEKKIQLYSILYLSNHKNW